MMTVPQDVAIRFFNSLMHGVDVTTIMRSDMPLWEMALGVVEIFVVDWLFGAVIAGSYNCCGKSQAGRRPRAVRAKISQVDR